MARQVYALFCLFAFCVVPFVRAEGQSVAELVQGSEFRYTKGNIDVQVLSNLIAERQKALSNEVLHRYLLRDQAGALSQNILNERLIDQLLNSHTPKEITQGIYSYTMETFALGMMTLALENSQEFGLPNTCTAPDMAGDSRKPLSSSCSESLRSGPLRSVFVVDSLLRLMKSSLQTMSEEASRQELSAPTTIDQVIEVLARRSHSGKGIDSARKRLKSIWLAYTKDDGPSLKIVHRHFLNDLAFVTASDSNSLFKGTLFRNESSQGYLKSYLRTRIINHWRAPSEVVYQSLRTTLFESAENHRKDFQTKLRERILLEYIQTSDDSAFKTWEAVNILRRKTKSLNITCASISDSSIKFTFPRLIDSIKRCGDGISERKEVLEKQLKPFEEFKTGINNAYSLASFLVLNPEAIKKQLRKLDSALDDSTRIIHIGSIFSEHKSTLDSLKGFIHAQKIYAVSGSTPADECRLYLSNFIISDQNGKNKLSGYLKIADTLFLDSGTSQSCADSIKMAISASDKDIAFLEAVSALLSIPPSSLRTRKALIDSVKMVEEIRLLAGGVKTLENEFGYIHKAKQSLNSLVTKDSLLVKLAAEYDAYLSLWLLQRRDSTNDTLAIFFLQKFLPALRKASFFDSGMKEIYKASIPLVGFVDIPKSNKCQKIEVLKPLIPWLANYSTRTRSQSLHSALQILRENDSLFTELIPSRPTREWFWLVTEGLDIDTSKDVISLDIPKLLVKIEKKYKDEVQASKLKVYPVLDIGTFTGFAVGKEEKNLIQVASEKVGIGYAFFRAEPRARENLIEDPFDVNGKSGVSYVEKIGLELHASGLLYNSTNLKTNESFNDALVSGGLAVYFRIGLTARVAYGLGFNQGDLQHQVVQLAMDVPLADYLLELSKK